MPGWRWWWSACCSWLVLGGSELDATLLLVLRASKFREDGNVLQRRGVLIRIAARGNVSEEASHDLAASGLRQSICKLNHVRLGDRADFLASVSAKNRDVFVRWLNSGGERDKGGDPGALDLVGETDDRSFHH